MKEKIQYLLSSSPVKKAITWVIVVAVAVIILLTQFAFPVSVSYNSTNFCKYTSDSNKNYVKSIYDSALVAEELAETTTAVSTDENTTILPSPPEKSYVKRLSDTTFDFSDKENFLSVQIDLNFLNIGMYKVSNVQFNVDSIGEFADRFVYKDGNLNTIDRFGSAVVRFSYVIYVKDMSAEQIETAINSLKASYTFDRPELFASGGSFEIPHIDFSDDMVKNV